VTSRHNISDLPSSSHPATADKIEMNNKGYDNSGSSLQSDHQCKNKFERDLGD
jgi:hypothetical protein